MSKEIGLKIKELRRRTNMTQQDLADKTKISRSTLSNYEIGRRIPHLRDLQKFSKAFGVGLDYFDLHKKNEAFDLLTRAEEVFNSSDVPADTKEELYRDLMRLYLRMKEDQKNE